MIEWIRKLGLVFLAVGVLATGCQSAKGVEVSGGETSTVVPVVTQVAAERVFAEAVVEPVRSVTLLAPVGGTLEEVPAV